MEKIDSILKETGIIPVIKISNAEDALPMAEALLKGGIAAAEITFRTSAAADAIARIAKEFPDMFVCAGTILSLEQANIAVQCGAKAVISPGTNKEIVAWCTEKGVPVYPGCATPTEVEAAMALGLTTVKLFPAEVVGGVPMLNALYGPYTDMKFMPTGGISTANAADYLALPNVIACGGSWICSDTLLAVHDFAQIEQNAREAAEIVKAIHRK